MTIASTLFYFRSSRTAHEDDAGQDRDGGGDGDAVSGDHRLQRALSRQSGRRGSSSRSLRRPSVCSVRLEHELGYQLEDRLPGPVLDARARLTERLRGFHLIDSRLHNSITRKFTNGQQNAAVGIRDPLDLEAGGDSKGLESGVGLAVSLPQSESVSSFRDAKMKPSSLRVVGLRTLKEETFIEDEDDNEIPKALLECPICLERIFNGDRMIRLNCGHKFHHACLEPWVQVHGVCPYCRSSLVN